MTDLYLKRLRKAYGWAVVGDQGEIDMATCGPTRRAACINFLVARRQVMVSRWTTDDEIVELWRRHKWAAELIQVDVVKRETAGSGPDLAHRSEFDVGLTAKAAPCSCWLCRRERGQNVPIMVLCPKCGNKRCPHANNHDYVCTGSNEPGQPGSAYP